ncbi:NusA-like transcription termination signal-binding factor [Candidatus Woesearchaeota archaeon]|nr:NusA-like transcription termination signal-binding factor [Candidatus Woesearchaeota archaeon]
MGKVILDQETLGLSLVFERLTNARVVDCFQDKEVLYFVVAQGEMGKALGKGAVHLRRAEQEFGKRVKLIEHADDLVSFVRNVVYPLRVEEIIPGESVVTLKDTNKKTKSLLIGREGKNLQLIKRAVKRFFNVDVRVE